MRVMKAQEVEVSTLRNDLKTIASYLESKSIEVIIKFNENNVTIIHDIDDEIHINFSFTKEGVLNYYFIHDNSNYDYRSESFRNMDSFDNFKEFIDEYMKIKMEFNLLRSRKAYYKDKFGIRFRETL